MKYYNLDVFLFEHLTPAEARVVRQVLKGLYNTEVADVLQIHHKTVKYHMTSVNRKLQLRNKAELILLCVPYLAQEITEENNSQFQRKNREKIPTLPGSLIAGIDTVPPLP